VTLVPLTRMPLPDDGTSVTCWQADSPVRPLFPLPFARPINTRNPYVSSMCAPEPSMEPSPPSPMRRGTLWRIRLQQSRGGLTPGQSMVCPNFPQWEPLPSLHMPSFIVISRQASRKRYEQTYIPGRNTDRYTRSLKGAYPLPLGKQG
jgi:hypothetical protein